MFGGWFSPGGEKQNSDKEPTAGPHRPGPVSSEIPLNTSRPIPESRPSLGRGVTTAISNPHDAVLAELITQGPELDSSARFDEVPGTASLKDEDLTSEGHHPTRSPHREPLHDPFTGSIIGFGIPDEREQEGVDFENTKDELWAHMAHIRELQSQIANMHVLMEGAGLGPQGEPGVVGGSVPLIHSSEADKWEDNDRDEEVEEKKAREQEFARLAEKFSGKREATNNIMNKLDELSQVVTKFHALRTPTVDFNGSRFNTQDSRDGTISPEPGDTSQPVRPDPPTVIIPPSHKASSQLPFIESPVSISIDRESQPLASKLPASPS